MGLSLIGSCLAGYFIYGRTDTDIQHYPPKKFVDWLALHAASSVVAEMHQITTWFIQHEYRATGDNHLTGKQIKAGYKRLKRLSK